MGLRPNRCPGGIHPLAIGRGTQDLSRRTKLCNRMQGKRKMAKFRLLSAHYINDEYLEGDKERQDRIVNGVQMKGEIVGDDTDHPIQWPTLEMEPLDDEAREMLAKEEERLRINDASMEPLEELAMDSFEENYIPGTARRRRPAAPHGAPARRSSDA